MFAEKTRAFRGSGRDNGSNENLVMPRTQRRPSQLLLMFAAAALLFCSIFVWLAWRLVEQDRHLERQLAVERLGTAAAAISDEMGRRLTALEADLDRLLDEPQIDHAAAAFATRIPDDSLLLTVEGDRLRVHPRQRVVYLPRVVSGDASATLFRDAEEAEFARKDYAAAIELLRPFARSEDDSVRAAALLRIARNFRKAGRVNDALAAYDELSAIGGVAILNSSADLLARYARCVIFDEIRSADLTREATALLHDLQRGMWDIDLSAYQFYLSECRRWLAPEIVSAPAAERFALSAAAEALDGEWERVRAGGEAVGRREFRIDGESMLLIWRSDGDRFAALAAGRSLFAPAPDALRTFEARLTSPAEVREPLHLARSVTVPALPWALEVRALSPPGDSSAIRARLVGLTAVAAAVLFAITVYFIGRAMAREMKLVRLKADFVGAVSHEFRTPLASIRQISEMLAEDRVAADRRDAYHERLRRESERLQSLVENLLDFQRLESNIGRERFQLLAVSTLVQTIVEEFRAEVCDNGYEIILHVEDVPPVRGDGEMVGRALWNLLDNAAKYSTAVKQIDVDVGSNGSAVHIAVRDRGVGIAAAEIDAIFEKFARGESARLTGARGSGLGLAMVREIAEAHGGSVTVDSIPGKGSTFTISLPAEGRS